MRLLAEPADYAIKVSPKFGVRKIPAFPGILHPFRLFC
jgi:hypothetical protein